MGHRTEHWVVRATAPECWVRTEEPSEVKPLLGREGGEKECFPEMQNSNISEVKTATSILHWKTKKIGKH